MKAGSGMDRLSQIFKNPLTREVYFYLFGLLYISFFWITGYGSMIFALVGGFSLVTGLSIRIGLPLWVMKYLTLSASALFSLSFFTLALTSIYIYGWGALGVASAIIFTLLLILSLIFLYYSFERSSTPR